MRSRVPNGKRRSKTILPTKAGRIRREGHAREHNLYRHGRGVSSNDNKAKREISLGFSQPGAVFLLVSYTEPLGLEYD